MIVYNRLKYLKTNTNINYLNYYSTSIKSISNNDKDHLLISNPSILTSQFNSSCSNKSSKPSTIERNNESRIETSTANHIVKQISSILISDNRDPDTLWKLYQKLVTLNNGIYLHLIQPSQYRTMIKVQYDCLTAKGYRRVLELIQTYQTLNYELNPKICKLTIQSLFKLDQPYEVSQFVENLIKTNPSLITTEVSNHLIKSYIQSQQISQAYKYIQKLSSMGIQWDIHSLINLSKLNLKLGKLKQFGQVYKFLLNNFKTELSGQHFNEILNEVLFKQYWLLADRMIKDMKREGVQPNMVTLTILMNSLLKLLGKNPSNSKLHPQRVQCIDSIYRHLLNNPNIKLDSHVQLSFARWFCRSGNLKKARSILGRIDCNKEHMQFTLLEGYINNNKIHDALALYDQMQRDRIGVDPKVFKLIGNVFWSPELKLGQFDRILTSIDGEPSVGRLNLVLGYLVNKMRIYDAYTLFKKHIDQYNIAPDIFTYSTLFKGLCSAGLASQSPPPTLQDGWLTIAQELYKSLEDNPNIVINLPVYNSILNAFSYFGDWQQVQLIYQTILDNDLQPNPRTLYPVIRMLLNNIPTLELPNALDQLPSFLSTPFYNSMIDAIVREDDLKGGLLVLNHLIDHPDHHPDSLTYKILLVKAGQLNDIQMVKSLLQLCQNQCIEFNCAMYEDIINAMGHLPRTTPDLDEIMYRVNMLRKVEEQELETEMHFDEFDTGDDWLSEDNYHERPSPEKINQIIYECYLSVVKLHENDQ